MPTTEPSSADRREAATAVEEMVDLYGDRLFGLGLRLCRTPEDAEDLVQETFLRAYRGWARFRGEAEPSTWLYTIASRVCARQHRRRAGQPTHLLSLDAVLPSKDDGVIEIPAGSESPLEQLIGREQRETVDRAIATVPYAYRIPLVLKELAELSVAEVAAILGLKEATVKTRLHRARLLVAKHLARTLPRRPAPPPDHARAICLALLRGKQEALDRHVPFRAEGELCRRCRSLFASLDLAHSACNTLAAGTLPAPLRRAIKADLAADVA